MDEAPPQYIAYGTAGFRDHADLLDLVLYRVGLVAALRSRALKGATIGVMITASHNPPQDNGAKLVDPFGDMLEQSWESKVGLIANAKSAKECEHLIDQLHAEFGVSRSDKANVVYGKDTRESGPRLTKRLEDGLEASGAHGLDLGLVTTPQLHYIVRAINTLGGPSNNLGGLESYGVPTQDGYYRKLVTALRSVFTPSRVADSPISVAVDCANGVGALKLKEMIPLLSGLVDVEIVNDECDKPEMLNVDCGADYVKTNQRLPRGISPHDNKLYASFDGDADRVVFYYTEGKEFHLLDGDKIATLIAAFLKKIVENTGTQIDIGVVQTAYANGSSTNYITEQLKLPVICTPTGVKHLHHAAHTSFGIGVYFEANGHGTVLFGDEATKRLRQIDVSNEAEKRSVDTLLALSDLINQTVGDAISDLLTVLAVLTVDHSSPAKWNAQYTDLPNRLLKAEVKDRTEFTTTDAERKLLTPSGLQEQIDALVSKVQDGRSFVRASGTENVVRVYAEAHTRQEADQLAENVRKSILEKWGP